MRQGISDADHGHDDVDDESDGEVDPDDIASD